MGTITLPTATIKQNLLPLVIALLATTAAASLFYTPFLLLILLGIPFLAYFISRPYELLLLMVFLIPFNFIFTIGPIPVAAELLKVFAWIPFIVYRRSRKNPFKASRYNKWFGVLAVILLFSIIRSHDLPFTVKGTVRLGSSLGLVYLVVNLVDDKEKLLKICKVLVVSTFIVACYGFYQWTIQDFGGLFWIVNPRIETSMAHYRDTFWEWRDRIISTLSSELELGHYFNLCLPIGTALWITEGKARISSKWLLMTIASLIGLLLTFTFGAWLALTAAVGLFVMIFDKKLRRKLLSAGVIVLLLFAAVLSYPPMRALLEPKLMGTAQGSFLWDVYTRLDMWIFAVQTWWSHPILGVGIGNYDFLESSRDLFGGTQGVGPHNSYVYLLADTGLLGIVSILAVIVGTIVRNLRLRADPKLGLMGLALAFALTANLFGWFSDDSVFFGPHCSYLLWLLVGLSEAVFNLSARNITSKQDFQITPYVISVRE